MLRSFSTLQSYKFISKDELIAPYILDFESFTITLAS